MNDTDTQILKEAVQVLRRHRGTNDVTASLKKVINPHQKMSIEEMELQCTMDNFDWSKTMANSIYATYLQPLFVEMVMDSFGHVNYKNNDIDKYLNIVIASYAKWLRKQ